MPAHDLRPRPIVAAGAAMVLVVAIAVGAVFLLLRHWGATAGQTPAAPAVRPAEGPVLQSSPQPDLAKYRAEKQRRLDSTGWVDRERGIVHVPVATAMAMLAQRAASAPNTREEPR
ncbi:MAG TPA: hypothetical protein VJ743_02890 [Albitalea sp.]|nr:hypothetical protein [Albitalea sp.]